MKPSELRELAEWHDERTKHISKIAEPDWLTDNLRQSLLDELENHTQSARALNFLADALEAEPVGYVDPRCIELMNKNLQESATVVRKEYAHLESDDYADADLPIIYKPTFGDDNEQS